MFGHVLASHFQENIETFHLKLKYQNKPKLLSQPQSFLLERKDCVWFQDFNLISQTEIICLMRKSNDSSPPTDCCPSKILKLCADETALAIADLFNSLFLEGVYQTLFKTSVVTPILKKRGSNINDKNKHRPIRGLHYLARLFERKCPYSITGIC